MIHRPKGAGLKRKLANLSDIYGWATLRPSKQLWSAIPTQITSPPRLSIPIQKG